MKATSKIHTFLETHAVAIVLCSAFLVMALTSTLDKCATYDEIAHLTSGYSYWVFNDYRLTPEAGNLGQRWFALPLLAGNYRFPSRDQAAWSHSDAWSLGRQFFYEQGNDLEAMLFKGRTMTALMGVALCLLVYHLSRELFGKTGAILALTVCVFNPTMLANGRLMTLDLPAALFFLLFVWRLWILLRRVTPATITWSCLSAAGLVLTKMSGLLAVPMAMALVIVRLCSRRALILSIGRHDVQFVRRPTQAATFAALGAAHVLACAVLIWAVNGFQFHAMNERRTQSDRMHKTWEELTDNSTMRGRILNFARDRRLLPEAYLHGFAFTQKYSNARSAFLNGKYSLHGWRSYFVYGFLYKTPLGLLALLGLALAGIMTAWRHNRGGAYSALRSALYNTAPLLTLFVVYWAVAVSSRLNIGHRHILPTYPPLFILVGGAAAWLSRKGVASLMARMAVLIALLAAILESLSIRPDYLAYFNQIAGGPRNGYRKLIDSNLDWGQDLPGLKRWIDRNGNGKRVYLSYFGTGDPGYYGISAELLTCIPDWNSRRLVMPLNEGIYCISATVLQFGGWLAPPWTGMHEAGYRKLDDLLTRYAAATAEQSGQKADVLGHDSAYWQKALETFDLLRFARLAHFLRAREPDDSVGHSILIYRLSEQDIKRALKEPTI